MAKAKKAAKKEAAKKPADKGNDLIKTISEVKSLTEKEQQAFRDAGGTTTQD